MGKTKRLPEFVLKQRDELIEQNKELRKQNKSCKNLLKFIEWLNALCMENPEVLR